jgi:RNA polymerase sigma factor (sigma-70 family)
MGEPVHPSFINAKFRGQMGELFSFSKEASELFDITSPRQDRSRRGVSEALEKLASRDPQGAQLIQLRFFAGFSNAEAGELLGLPERTAKRTWAYARAWLYDELKKTL